MKCPKCGFEQPDQNEECPRCGIIFKKIHGSPKPSVGPGAPNIRPTTKEKEPTYTAWDWIKNILFFVKDETNPLILGGRALVLLVLMIWGVIFIITPMESNYTAGSIWHSINLPFHEAGHVIFRIFGRFMMSLGGSLAQILMPLICLAVFLLKTRDAFAASFCLWWTGQNFMDLAPYINDARSLTLPLLGGNTGRTSPYGFHDWEFILKETGLIQYDHVLAHASYKFGSLLMILAFAWGGYILYRQYRNL